MFSNVRRPTARWRLVALIAGLCSAIATAQDISRGPQIRVAAPSIPASAKDIVIKGEPVCLRRLPDASGRILLDCAIGLRGDDDQFYGLRAPDPTRAAGYPVLNTRVRVTGRLIPHGGGKHVESGQIVYDSIEPIPGEPKPVTGTFLCLLPARSGAPPVDGCRSVIKTDRSLLWGLDMRSLEAIPTARGLAPGERISLEGDIVQQLPEDWHPWMFVSDAGSLEGVLTVRTLKRVAH